MSESNQPKDYDAVLGGQSPSLLSSAVLGGLNGIKQRISSTVDPKRIASLKNQINPVREGLKLGLGAEGLNLLHQMRIIFLEGEINHELSMQIISIMLYLDSIDSGKDIYLYINSLGGSVLEGMAIYDTMQSLTANVVTVNLELTSGISGLLLAAGTKGKRFARQDSQIVFTQVACSSEQSDLVINEVAFFRQQLNEIWAFHISLPLEKIKKATSVNLSMSAQEAKEYGLIDHLIA